MHVQIVGIIYSSLRFDRSLSTEARGVNRSKMECAVNGMYLDPTHNALESGRH